MSSHYSFDSVRSSFIHFFLGKALTALLSVGGFFLVARTLVVEEFAAYTVFQAAILIIGLTTSFGVAQTIPRYVPELRASNNNKPMYRLIISGIGIRMVHFAVVLALAGMTGEWWAPIFSLTTWFSLLLLYLPVGWLRLSNMFIFRTMESLMWQKATQYSLAGGALVRFASVAGLVWLEKLSLHTLILAEVVSESIVLVALAGGFLYRWRVDPLRDNGDPNWLLGNRERMQRYARWGYFQAISNMLYGGATNRIAASALFPAGLVGLFGFVDSLMDYGQRYLPTRMFHGLIQPLYFARFSSGGDFQEIGHMANATFRASVLVLGLPAVVLVAGGEGVVDWLTAGKYGRAAYLLLGVLVVLCMESLRSQLEVMVQAIERNEVFIVSNLALSCSLPVALLLLSQLGLWAFIVGGIVGNGLSMAVVLVWFRRLGLKFHFDWWMTIKALAIVTVCGLTGLFAGERTSVWMGCGLGLIGYVTLAWYFPPLKQEERAVLLQLVKRRRTSLA